MKLREILRLRQVDGGGAVPHDVLIQLELPIPEDVLEQFVMDHSTKEEFQQQYGHLDLHAIDWHLAKVTAREFLSASIFRYFQDWPSTVADRTRVVPVNGWSGVVLPRGAASHWKEHGTWMRPPIALRGELVKSKQSLHLVEGHTRFGALKGLVEAGVLSPESLHDVWVGEPGVNPKDDGPWRDVVRREGVNFQDWLTRQIEENGTLGVIAARLVDVKYGSQSSRKVRGHDLVAVLEFASGDKCLEPFQDAIRKAHELWVPFVNP